MLPFVLVCLACEADKPPPPEPPPVVEKLVEVDLLPPPPPPPSAEREQEFKVPPEWEQFSRQWLVARDMADPPSGMETRWKHETHLKDFKFRRMVCHAKHKEGLVCTACYTHKTHGFLGQLSLLCEWEHKIHYYRDGRFDPHGGCEMLFTTDRWDEYGIDPAECER